MNLRKLTPEDAGIYQIVRLRALQEFPEAFGSSYEESAGRPVETIAGRIEKDGETGGFILGAFEQTGQLVGVVGFYREQQKKMRHKGTIWGMYVSPEHQGRGIGRRLLEEAIELARALPGMEQLNLTVVATNERARRLYEALGFKIFGVEPNALQVEGRYYDEIFMRLELNPGLYLAPEDVPAG